MVVWDLEGKILEDIYYSPYNNDYIIKASSNNSKGSIYSYWITIDFINIYKVENNKEIKEKLPYYNRLNVMSEEVLGNYIVRRRFFYGKELIKVIPQGLHDDYFVYIKGKDY